MDLMTREVLVARINRHRIWLVDQDTPEGARLILHDEILRSGIHLYQLPLDKMVLDHMYVPYLGCDSCSLTGMRMLGGELDSCRFEDCTLAGAFFRDVMLQGTRFIRCDLTGVTFQNCDLCGVDFRGSDLRQVGGIACRANEEALLERIRTYVLDEQSPITFYMGHWLGTGVQGYDEDDEPICGTSACLAGTAAHLTDPALLTMPEGLVRDRHIRTLASSLLPRTARHFFDDTDDMRAWLERRLWIQEFNEDYPQEGMR